MALSTDQKAHRSTVEDWFFRNGYPAILRMAGIKPQRGYRPSVYMALKTIILYATDAACDTTFVADELDMHRESLSRAFTADVGIKLSVVIDLIRMEAAKELLRTRPEIPLKQLHEHVGYGCQSTLYNSFRYWTDMTPGAWRQCHGRRRK